MSVPYEIIKLLVKQKGNKMSANKYTIEGLLIGRSYRSASLEGIITDADEHDAWYGTGYQAYRVKVRPTIGLDTYRVVAVATSQEACD